MRNIECCTRVSSPPYYYHIGGEANLARFTGFVRYAEGGTELSTLLVNLKKRALLKVISLESGFGDAKHAWMEDLWGAAKIFGLPAKFAPIYSP